MLPFGAGVGLAFGVMDNAAVSTVAVEHAGAAAGIFDTMRITGESVAVAGAAAWLTSLTAGQLRDSGLDAASATQLAGQAVQGQARGTDHPALATAFTGAFHTLGLALALLSTLGAILTYLALAPDRTGPGAHRPLPAAS
ncbi:MFS transporter [Kitasatospora azatica]|uniref:hypothetical protein n=1 Tax=Kitasatospora azatica TaxID=58347 RepID=UPI001E29840F|nr:hypothetical protein [Kitasatospora azatica]